MKIQSGQPKPTSPPPAAEVAEHLAPTLLRVAGFRAIAELAAGGMAVLYRGVQESLGRPVAIKALRSDVLWEAALPDDLGERPDWPARFAREARLLSQLRHENLVHVYDLIDERPQGGSLFIIMELCEGIDLLDLTDGMAARGLPPILPTAIVAIIGLEVARALAEVHRHCIVHRDLKPANLLLTWHGGVKLVDFGTAWDPENPRDLSGAELSLGTPSYMSPEQATGESLDHRSDQFSLGAVLYQLLAGRKPFFPQPGQSLLAQVVAAQPPPLLTQNSAVPKELADIIARCMQREPARRYPCTGDLVLALERFVGALSPRRELLNFLRDQPLQVRS